MPKNKYLIFTVLIVLTAISLNYFFATFLPSPFKAIRLLLLGITVVLGTWYSFSFRGKGFIFPVQIQIFSMILSVFISYLTWDQPIQYGFLITVPYLLWPIFFILLKIKVSIDILEKVIIIFGVSYIVLYFYQFFNPTNVMFNYGMVDDEYEIKRGIIRIIFPGMGIFWLSTYIALNNLTQQQNRHKIFWMVLMLLGILLPFMQAVRSYIVPTMIVYFFHFAKNLSIAKKVIISFLFIVGSFYVGNIEIPVIEGLMEQQEKTMDDGTKDIRYIAATYYVTQFSPYPINQILGNGMGHERSSYGQFISHLYGKGLFFSDIGIFGVYALFGIFPLISWAIIGYKVYKYPIPKKYMYVKYYFFNVFFGAFIGSTLYHINVLIASIFALYIFQVIIDNKRYRLINKLRLLEKVDPEKLKTILSTN